MEIMRELPQFNIKNITNQQIIEFDLSDRKLATRDDLRPRVFDHEYSVFSEDDEDPTEKIDRRFETNILNIFKTAGDFEDTTRGAAVGAGVGLVAGYAADEFAKSKLMHGIIPSAKGSNGLLNYALNDLPRQTHLLNKVPAISKARKYLYGGLGGFGLVAGAAAGLLSKNKKSEPEQDMDYYNSQFQRSKYASEDHAFITDTGVETVPSLSLPDDIKEVVNLSNPALKYFPAGFGATAAGLAATYTKLKRGKIDLNKASLSGLAGALIGSVAKREVERSVAKPYMQMFSDGVDAKYKEANIYKSIGSGAAGVGMGAYLLNKDKQASDTIANEYISETGVRLIDPKVGPKKFESVITYNHPWIDEIPTMVTGAGGVIGYGLKKNIHGALGGTLAGSILGTLGRMGAVEHYMNPYRKAYINEVNEKYGLNG